MQIDGLSARSLRKRTRGTAGLLVAASDSSAIARQNADYICDGTADDDTIEVAMAALGANGGSIFLAAGTYNCVNQIVFPVSNITLSGEGYPTHLFLNTSTNTNILYATGKVGLTVRDLRLDGNADNQNAAWGHKNGGDESKNNNIYFVGCSQVLVDHVWSHSSMNNAVLFYDGGENCSTVNSFIYDCEWHGIEYWTSIGHSTIENNICWNCCVSPIVVEHGANTNRCIITGNVVKGGAKSLTAEGTRGITVLSNAGGCIGVVVANNTLDGVALATYDVTYCVITGNTITFADNNWSALDVKGDYCTISDNTVYHSGVPSATENGGLRVSGVGNVVKGNVITIANATHGMGIYLCTGCSGCVVIGNRIKGSHESILNYATDSLIANNLLTNGDNNGIRCYAPATRNFIYGNMVYSCTRGGYEATGISGQAWIGNYYYNITNMPPIQAVDGAFYAAGNYGIAETKTADGAATRSETTYIDSTSTGVDLTLADGILVGQRKLFVMIQASNASTVIVAHCDAGDGVTFTFDAVDETLELIWTGTEWAVVFKTCT